ncbi:MAG: flagellar protein FlaG [Actinobacteria bacterium]|nr:flagellar protein FlaG [Actinomycetota bacterium]MCA1806863.1 flagellar protein FlaG [Actinomycetota bacterium]
MFKSFSLNQSIIDMAAQVEKSGYSVDASYGEATVKIINRETREVVVEFEEENAVDFIENAENLASDARVDIATALLAEAKQYTDVQ